MTRRPPEARDVVEENTIVVHRTHDVTEARRLAHELRWMHDDPVEPWIADGGEQVWLRTCPVGPDGDLAFLYRRADEGDRGAFRAVVFSTEPQRQHWWKPRERTGEPS